MTPDEFIEQIPGISMIRSEALEFAAIGLYRFRFDGTIVFMDRGAMRIFEIDDLFDGPEALSGLKIGEIMRYIDEPGKLREEIVKRKRIRGLEYKFKTLRGKRKWLICDSYLEPGKKPEDDSVQVIVRDITEQKIAEEMLLAEKDKFRVMTEEITDGVVVMIEGKCVWANKAATEITGWPVEDLLGHGIDIFIVAEEVPSLKERMRKRVDGISEPSRYESTGVSRSGERVIVEISAKRIVFEGRKAVMIVIRDVTDRKKIENDLKLKAQEFLGIFEAFPDLFFRFDKDGNILDAHAGRETDFIVPQKEFLNKNIAAIMPPEIGEKALRMIEKARKSALLASMEYSLDFPDGSRYYEARFVPIFDRQVISFIRDITKKKEAEIKLRENERFLESVFESIQDGISVLDTELNIIHVNPTMEKWYSHSAPLASKKCFKAYHGTDEPCGNCPSITAIKTGKASVEIVPMRGDGGEITGWAELFAFPLKDISTGKITGVIEYVRDITARKIAEDELQRHRLNLEELVSQRTKELEAAQEMLVEAERLAVLGQFSGGISHEIRNPLNVIAATVYSLKKKTADGDEKLIANLDIIKKQVDKCADIIESILRLTKKQPPVMERIDATGFIGGFITSLQPPENITVRFHAPEEPDYFRGDAEQMSLVMKNLCSNSIQAMQDGGALDISIDSLVKNGKDYVVISVADTGSGISSENIEKIFLPLFTTRAKGIGFGLSIVRMIIERHAGAIYVKSEVDEGTTIRIELPAAE